MTTQRTPARMDIVEIMRYLPHRYPFLLVDRVTRARRPSKSIRGIKNVTMNEPFFQGHFPGLSGDARRARHRGAGAARVDPGVEDLRHARPAAARSSSSPGSTTRASGARSCPATSCCSRPTCSGWCAASASSRSAPTSTARSSPRRRCWPRCGRTPPQRRAPDDGAHPSDGARRPAGRARRRRRGRRLLRSSARTCVVGAGTRDRPARRGHRPHDARRAQPHLPVRLDRRDPAGPQVRRRADDDRRSATTTCSASSCRSTPAPRRTAATRRSATATAPRLHAHRARLRRRQQHDVLEQRAARRPRRHRATGWCWAGSPASTSSAASARTR